MVDVRSIPSKNNQTYAKMMCKLYLMCDQMLPTVSASNDALPSSQPSMVLPFALAAVNRQTPQDSGQRTLQPKARSLL